ncbi:MAG: sugar phosphate isomerase/epimerase [Saprospiraceae bacterium]|nr:sugar phosphate isomerase/epimerase [Saprospiraceae bacterium]
MSLLKSLLFSGVFIVLFGACGNEATDNPADVAVELNAPKFSLAQWSFHKALFDGEIDNFDFIRIAAEMDFEGVEYVSQFFQDKVEDFTFLDSLNAVSAKAGVQNLLIMVDNAGNLGASDQAERNLAVENCKKWVLAAKYLGCKSIRVNAHGDGSPTEMMEACTDAIGRLGAFAKAEGMTVLIENHGGISSNGAWLAELLTTLAPYDVGGILDFNNWCIAREGGGLWNGECIEVYDRFKGMRELMPFAKSVSVKSFEFDEAGEETSMDYKRLVGIVQDAGYDGYFGIEFESSTLPSREGVEKTRALVKKYWKTGESE